MYLECMFKNGITGLFKTLFRKKEFTIKSVEKKLYKFCKKYQKIKRVGCKDCPVEGNCRRFLTAAPNLYYTLVDAEAMFEPIDNTYQYCWYD